MVSQLQEEVTAEKARADAAVAERDKIVAERDTAVTKAKAAETKAAVFKLKCQNKNPEEIAGELGLSVEYVNSVLNEP